MNKHTKIYFDYYSLTEADFIECEVCYAPSVEIHHIKPKGMGGTAGKDVIENLIAVCRECHVDAHASKISKEDLLDINRTKRFTKG